MRIPSLPFPQARELACPRFLDLRSPREFGLDHVPGARNVPLFDDEQRALVGFLYKQVSPELALEEGLRIVRGRLFRLLERILGHSLPPETVTFRFLEVARMLRAGPPPALELVPAAAGSIGEAPLVLSCWRGGSRSRSVAALLLALGQGPIVHLADGYKGYRAWVRRRLAAFDSATPLIVLRGPTGIGKTRILHRLEETLPGSTLDLEGMARHRSSILGDVGLEPAGTRTFESALAARLEEMGPPPWFVEGESRKVGDRVVPENLFHAMENGVQVRLDAPLAHRIQVLQQDYLASPQVVAQVAERLPFLEKRLGSAWVGRLQDWLQAGAWEKVAQVLLVKYYDVRYARSDRRRSWGARLDVTRPGCLESLLALRSERVFPASNPASTLASIP